MKKTLTFWTFSDERDVQSHLIEAIENGGSYATPGPTLCRQERFDDPPRGGAWTPHTQLATCVDCAVQAELLSDGQQFKKVTE